MSFLVLLSIDNSLFHVIRDDILGCCIFGDDITIFGDEWYFVTKIVLTYCEKKLF